MKTYLALIFFTLTFSGGAFAQNFLTCFTPTQRIFQKAIEPDVSDPLIKKYVDIGLLAESYDEGHTELSGSWNNISTDGSGFLVDYTFPSKDNPGNKYNAKDFCMALHRQCTISFNGLIPAIHAVSAIHQSDPIHVIYWLNDRRTISSCEVLLGL